jgi:pimeloyl-ACP methyl ester carboxylesterase
MVIGTRNPELPEWLHEAYPFPTKWLKLGDFGMSMVDAGPENASAMVLLHGNPTWSFLFRQVIRRAMDSGARFRVVAPDLIGFGLSDKPVDGSYHTLDRHIENLSRLIESLALRNVTLVGHEWGGAIALGYAVANPANISRMVLADTFGFPVPNLNVIRRPRSWRLVHGTAVGRWLDSWLNLTLSSTFSHRTKKPLSDLTLEAYKYPFHEPSMRIAPRAFTEMFFEPDKATSLTLERIAAGLKGITAPVDILWGGQDPVLTRVCAYLLRDRLKHAREPIFFPDSGHYLPEEAPEAFASNVLEPRSQAPAPAGPTDVFRIIS